MRTQKVVFKKPKHSSQSFKHEEYYTSKIGTCERGDTLSSQITFMLSHFIYKLSYFVF